MIELSIINEKKNQLVKIDYDIKKLLYEQKVCEYTD